VIRGISDGAVDLGSEPPLAFSDGSEDAPPIRAVSMRWLTGTILTGLTSIFLMGGALMVALNDPNQFATMPDNSDGLSAELAADDAAFGTKSDRIRPVEEAVASRQILQVSTVTREGERDFIKLRPFARIAATLAMRKDKNAAIPAYDALRIFADNSPVGSDDAPAPAAGGSSDAGSGSGDDQIYGANVDGEVSVKVSDFPAGTPIAAKVSPATDEVERIVRAAANFAPDGDQVAALPYVDPSITQSDGDEDPFSALGVKIVPENVSNIAKSEEADSVATTEEKVVAVAKGQTFRDLLEGNGVDDEDADRIVTGLSGLVDLNKMHVGQKIRVAFAPDAAGGPARPVRISLYDTGAHQATVARADDNSFVRADEPNFVEEDTGAPEPADDEIETAGSTPRVYDAVYQTALEQQVPTPLIDQLIRIFAFDVDFQARITPGDSIEVFHSMQDPHDPEAGEPEILFASLTLGGVTKRFYRFRSNDDGVVDYYDDEGKSAKKFLMRKPMTVGVLRSTFGVRVHPILGYRRMHTGVDFAAPRGTPILAAGNGVIEKMGPTSGYGNFTLLRHTNGYETGYGHQSAFAKGLKPGTRVRQGQIIGYVGSTGLSTGPHLHFEIRVNGSPVDPLRIRLPRGRVLQGDMLATFERERQRIDALLANPPVTAKVASANN
jgi:murein DD-endopeptidase MepM/ murein hydrolase activator NlpD